ncbi:MAG: ABC transporter substrate-binding protein [Bdellovibrionota bacterium]
MRQTYIQDRKTSSKFSDKILTLIFISSLLVSFGCTQKNHDPKESVTLAFTAQPKSIDPRITTDATGQRLNSLIFSSFVRTDSVIDIKGEAAHKWDYKNKTYTFYLHKGLTFSNGDPVTKEDILYTFTEYLKPSNPFKSSFDLIDTVDANFDGENPIVKVKLKKFSAVFLTDLSLMKILPKKLIEQYGDTFGDHLVGSGAYKIASRNLSEIILEARENPMYKPKVKYLVFKVIQDDSTRFLNAYKGSLDIIQFGLPLTKIAYVEKQNKYNVFKYPGSSMNYMLLNLKDKDFQNKEFRWALSKALNRDEIIKYKLEGYGESATSLLPSNNPYHNHDLKKIEYDPEAAKAGIQKMNLKNKEFILKTSNNPEVVEYARVIAAQLTRAGLNVKIQSYEWGTFYGDVKSGNFQMAIMRWVGLTDPDIYRQAFHSREFPPGRNRGFYSNPSLDPALDEGIVIEDVKKRIAHYNMIQKIIFDEQIIIPLWYNTLVDIVHKRITGYVPPVSGDLSPVYNIEIKESQQ